MAEGQIADNELPVYLRDSKAESDFFGFDDDSTGQERSDDNSDVDFDGLEKSDDDENNDDDSSDNEGETQWTDVLTDFQVPDFDLTAEILFPLPDDPQEIDVFSAFCGDDLFDWIALQTNLYARQKLSAFPLRLAKYIDVTRDCVILVYRCFFRQ